MSDPFPKKPLFSAETAGMLYGTSLVLLGLGAALVLASVSRPMGHGGGTALALFVLSVLLPLAGLGFLASFRLEHRRARTTLVPLALWLASFLAVAFGA